MSNLQFKQTDEIYKTHKDPLLIKSNKNVVHKINCKNCEACYVD